MMLTRTVVPLACIAVAAVGCAGRQGTDLASSSASSPAATASTKAPTTANKSDATEVPDTSLPVSPVPSTTTVALPSHCDSATIPTLTSATQMQYGAHIFQPFTLESVSCADGWAIAHIPPHPPQAPQPEIVLFHYTGGGWSAVQHGSGFNCTDEGVPEYTAAQLDCG